MAQDETLEDGLYWRVGAGASFIGDWRQDISYNPAELFLVAPPNRKDIDFDKGLTFAAALGFDYADGIRTELEYRYAFNKVESVTTSGGFFPPATTFPDEDLRVHLLMTNFYFDFTNDGPFTPFIGGGVGGAFVINEEGDRDAALAVQARAGIAVELAPKLSLDAEFIYLRTNELSYGPRDEDYTPAGPFDPRYDDDRYQSSSVMISVRRTF